MRLIKGKTIQKLESYTHYQACTFYLDNNNKNIARNIRFTHCSFRGNTTLFDLRGCEFDHCGGKFAVDFSGRKLVKFPQNLPKKLISAVNIGHNTLHSWQGIEELSEIESLQAEFGRIRRISDEILQLKTLSHLNLYANYLEVWPVELEQFPQLEYLNLGGNPLKEISPHIQNLRNLQHLNIQNTEIKVLPTEFSELTKLKTLDLNHNYLRKIPPTIENLQGICELNLVNNQLREFPMQILSLKNLQVLDLRYNALKSIPDISKLSKLQNLSISIDNISSFPSQMEKLQNLTRLHVDCNEVDFLPHEITQLKNLAVLWLDAVESPLRKIPLVLKEMNQLQQLFIEDVNEGLVEKLKLWLPKCKITAFPKPPQVMPRA
ncbi:leucine-rich repeat domain-containing protein [Candidatus Uabimicrobium amorphum]|uniref:Disease resistance R13L4/SHOC-2-like LRR domain-containing protein n=1 Tax=Uabimicrobium amorphum TaxID=2596890 RepID=A0A5S9IPM6_UABAM|nr:leucine-rich repeat domain-containing protein [Candidatus Uabimicrobium amorphum]BBM85739.1 hypothetical protein UABAM_04117 [Candidatus Uabimicrobium amorphum]